jgi:hypothetical protein
VLIFEGLHNGSSFPDGKKSPEETFYPAGATASAEALAKEDQTEQPKEIKTAK